jgi:phosphoserine phosphatase
MVQIVLIRPGSTDFDVQGRIQGRLDIPLNEQGRGEVAATVECLRGRTLSALYCSACQAAQETAELIGASLKLKPKLLDRLQNLDHGLWQGMLIEEVKRKHPKVYKQWQEHPENICPPEGEMLSAVAERTVGQLDKLLRKHRFGMVGMVASEPLASVIRSHLLGTEVGDLWKAANGCGQIEVIDVAAIPPRPPRINGKTDSQAGAKRSAKANVAPAPHLIPKQMPAESAAKPAAGAQPPLAGKAR